jgi:predicted RNA-binding protein
MCETAVFIVQNEKEEPVGDDLACIVPVGDKVELITIMGEKKVIDAKIKEINLLKHKIILE